MAKQIGGIQFRGKLEGYSGYVVKGGTGAVVRTINPNMSSRVKTEMAFKNTRSYAEKFKAVKFFTNFANMCLYNNWYVTNAAQKRPNYGIHSKDMQTEIYRYINERIAADTTHPVGYQQLLGTNWQVGLCGILNKYSRNKYFTNYDFVDQCNVSDGTSTQEGYVHAELVFGEDNFAMAIEQGFTHIEIQLDICSAKYDRDAPDDDSVDEPISRGVLIKKSFALTQTQDLSKEMFFKNGFWSTTNGDNKCHIYILKYTFYKGSVSEDKKLMQNTGFICWTGDVVED